MVGYQCLENTRQTLWLVNSKRNLEIRYDMRKYPCIYGKISHIRELRCNIIIRYGYHSVECFSMRDFKALHIEDDVLVYNDQEHFEQAILEFTELITAKIATIAIHTFPTFPNNNVPYKI